MVKSLLELSCKNIAEFIQNGLYSNKYLKLDSTCSNIVYSYLMEGDDPFELKPTHKLNVTKVYLQSYQLDENTAMQLKEFTLEELKIGNFSGYRRSFWCSYRNRKTYVDVARILEAVLNEESRQKLRSLNIRRYQKLKKGWPEQVGRMLPPLTSLAISEILINEDDFYQLCCNFPNLRSLDISGTNIKSLAGISRLRKLEVLSLRDVLIDGSKELKDLFNLKTLMVLDISKPPSNKRIHESSIVKQFIDCKMSLPALKFLDCTRTNMSVRNLEYLLQTQHNLQEVVTIRTTSNSSICENARVLNTSTFDTSVRALVHCLNTDKIFDCAHCIKKLNVFMSNDKLRMLDVRYCMEIIIEAMKKSDICITRHGLKCLMKIGIEYSHQLCSYGVELLIDALLSVDTYRKIKLNTWIKLNVYYWNAIEKLTNLKIGRLNFNIICRIAMSFLTENDVSQTFGTRALSVLCQCIHRMHSDELKSLSEKIENVNQLVTILDWSAEQKDEMKFLESLEVLVKMSGKNSITCTNLARTGIISIVLSYVENFESNDINAKFLELLTNLSAMMNDDILQDLCTPSTIEKIGLMLTRLKDTKTFQATLLLTKLLPHAEGNQVLYNLINQLLTEKPILAIGIEKIHI